MGTDKTTELRHSYVTLGCQVISARRAQRTAALRLIAISTQRAKLPGRAGAAEPSLVPPAPLTCTPGERSFCITLRAPPGAYSSTMFFFPMISSAR